MEGDSVFGGTDNDSDTWCPEPNPDTIVVMGHNPPQKASKHLFNL